MFVLLGANGNITSRVARLLLQQDHAIRVVGRSAASMAPLEGLGAELAVGDVRDEPFLRRAFQSATAAYVMIPTDYGAPDLRAWQSRVGSSIAAAIAGSGIRRVVNLSSIGADVAVGTGPIAGLHEQEQRLNILTDIDLLHLRPGYFMENHVHAVATIAALDTYPSLERSEVPVPMIATRDIAAVVVRELLDPASSGILHLHAPRYYSFREAAAILGQAIGRPALQHVQMERTQGLAAMMADGFSRDAAEQMAQLADWITSNTHASYEPVTRTPTTLEEFAPVFKSAFEAQARGAAQ